jgi:hypothetical protein
MEREMFVVVLVLDDDNGGDDDDSGCHSYVCTCSIIGGDRDIRHMYQTTRRHTAVITSKVTL